MEKNLYLTILEICRSCQLDDLELPLSFLIFGALLSNKKASMFQLRAWLQPAPFILSLCLFSNAGLAQLPEGFAQVRIAEGLDPTSMALAPDGRIFITEKSGKVRIVREGQLLPEPFLQLDVDNYNERGLGGIAFHPGFEQNHYVYLYYTVPDDGHNRISRFTANGDYAIPGSEKIILDLDPLSGTVHNGGAMAFGPDGKLFVATGDGAQQQNAQSMSNLLGKFLRLNDDGSIPADNPFYEEAEGKNRAIWALGLRNPFTFAVQPGTGRIFANDVGNAHWEEVNNVVRGGNYGWARIEGERTGQEAPVNYRDPLYAYDHGTGCAVIGAVFYNPENPTFPERYHGKYFFGDYCNGYVKVLDPETGAVEETFATGIDRPVALLVDAEGVLYYLARAGMGGGSMQDNTRTTDGSLWQVYYAGDGSPVISTQPRDLTVSVGENASFRVSASGTAPLRYQWEHDGAPVAGAGAAELIIENAQLSDDGSTFRCRVSNRDGNVLSAAATLTVTTNTRPVPQITGPVTGTTYIAGDTLHFSGHATDAEDGQLDASHLRWRIDFHHDEHHHPGLGPTTGIRGGAFAVPQLGEIDDNVWYRIHLTATDEEGLSQSVYRDIFPEKTQFTVLSEPAGLEVNVDGRLVKTPHTVTSVVGLRRTLGAEAVQSRDNFIFRFARWPNEWTEYFYSFLAGEEDTIRVRYESIELAIGDGTGLLGEYFQGEAPTAFEEDPVLVRVDPVVNFDWGFGSPDPTLEADFFLTRWRGEVMPPVDGRYTFHVISDDGVRLWVNDQLVIDQWVLQAATTSQGDIELEGGRRYPIRLEYFEAGGHAVARLLWSNEVIRREIIPATQLFPGPRLDFEGNYELKVYPSPARDWVRLEVASKIEDLLDLRIFDLNGRLLRRRLSCPVTPGLNSIDFDLANLSAGLYVLEINGSFHISEVKRFAKY
jgi:glucose/arabinose dehydrogenase